jgi:3-oxoacyl-[acyl-carrier-protein] synthase I
MSSAPTYVVGLGAATCVGRDAWSSAAAVRAGISGFTQHPYMVDSAGERMTVALAPWLDIGIRGIERLQALCLTAIDEALQAFTSRASGLRTALALALPAPRPGLHAEIASGLKSAVQKRYEGIIQAVATFPNGHAAGLLALHAAQRRLVEGAADACVVVGVDSYLESETLEWLESCDQLHSAGPLNNAWGFVPGEAAAAFVLVRTEVMERFHDVLLAQVLGVGTATEAHRIKTPSVCIGAGLTAAFRAALASLPAGETISDVYCDMNGEPYRADEYGFTCLRTKEHFQAASEFIAPADCCGDVGAAGAPLQIALAAIAGNKGYANGTTSLIWASSEGGERGAAVMRLRRGAARAG